MDNSKKLARVIIKGFNRHIFLFQQITKEAKLCFEQAKWQELSNMNADRISFYSKRVLETVEYLKKIMVSDDRQPDFWIKIKKEYREYLWVHPQAELAETFYNSVFCKLFNSTYYNNHYIFKKSHVSRKQLPAPIASVYDSYFSGQGGIKRTIRQILTHFEFNVPFEDMARDIKLIIRAFASQTRLKKLSPFKFRFDILKTVFFRNHEAYIIGRILTPNFQKPFILSLVNRYSEELKSRVIITDALLTDDKDLNMMFSFYRSYFMVETEVPSALVHFLQELIPDKKLSELYSSIGFYKQGKTEFYRELTEHLNHSKDKFVISEGIPGLVMLVFTLPSFPYVFKVIRDHFGASKDTTEKMIKDKYMLIKKHDRVGRLADTFEYAEVVLPKNRFSKECLLEICSETSKNIEEQGSHILFKHVYIERKMVPLDIYLSKATPKEQKSILTDLGFAIKDIASVNIFPGDLLLKNFGVTPYKRVIFYDYDEVQYLTDIHFRNIPKPIYEEQELMAEPWYSIGPLDVFPEQFPTFITPNQTYRECLFGAHPELASADYWSSLQERILAGNMERVYPYNMSLRFKHRF